MTDMTWSQTRTGLRWDILAPDAARVNWWDIATALSNLCRFNGHTRKFYSVAEHSALVLDAVLRETQDWNTAMFALLHDAHEAYLGDMTTPLANALTEVSGPVFRLGWSALRRRHDAAIFAAAGMEEPSAEAREIVKRADHAVLMTERDAVLGAPPEPWGSLEGVQPADVQVEGLPPSEARWLFLRCLHGLAPQLIFPERDAA